MEVRKFTKMIYWTIWTVFLLVKHGTLVSAMVTQTFQISENLPVDSIVGRLTGSPPYILYENPNEGAVQSDLIIDTNSGVIKVGAKLDREKLDKYTFGIYSNDGLNIRVTVKVTDVNDNSPTFKKASMTIQLSESAPEGLKIPLGTAVDKDLGVNSTQRYEIISKSSDDIPFSVVTRSGDNGYAELVVKKALDYETKKRYDLIVRAYDGGNPPRYGDLRVIVELSDSNDLYPVFTLSRYSARISENATVGTSIVQVLATDGDSGDNGKVRYSIDRGRSDPDNIFSISSDSGIIYLQKKLDFETKQTYELVVIARDNGSVPLQTTAIVSIQVENINEHPPVIDLVFLTGDGTPRVPENAQPGDYVARISVHDPDVPSYFANVNVTLEGGDGFFGLTTRDNVVYLMVISRPLTDDDTKPFYMLTVTATDAGIPSLTTRKTFDLRVATYNDPPKFSKKVYYANLKEDAPPGSSVYQLTAKDYDFGNNSVLSYSLSKIPGSHYEWFHINAKTGLVTTASRVDCETAAQPHITVVATDAGKPPLSSNTTLVITIMDNNDNQPIFDHSFYNITIPESQPKGSCIIKVRITMLLPHHLTSLILHYDLQVFISVTLCANV